MKITKARGGKAKAIHADIDGEHHVVGIGNLHVAISPEGKYWIAQGLEIDYVAQGTSLTDVQKQFEEGLACTIAQHLSIFGHIKGLLMPAPREVWVGTLEPGAVHKRFFQVTSHEIIKKALPAFDQIEYLELANAA